MFGLSRDIYARVSTEMSEMEKEREREKEREISTIVFTEIRATHDGGYIEPRPRGTNDDEPKARERVRYPRAYRFPWDRS